MIVVQTNSRERMLAAIRQAKPDFQPLPDRLVFGEPTTEPVEQFKTVLTAIGATVVEADDYNAVRAHVREAFGNLTNVAVTVPELFDLADFSLSVGAPHELEHVNLALLPGQVGVAESGAIWLTERDAGQRALPFITQHLALVISRHQVVPTMHQAYEKVRISTTGFGVFIAGPSKTADIEQSLVIGAHGARSLTVYLLA